MERWRQSAIPVEDETTAVPRWMAEAELIDEGGPSALGRDERRLNEGRASLEIKARLMPGPLGVLYNAIDPLARADQGFVGDAARQTQKMLRGAVGSPLEGALFSLDDEIIGGAVGLFDKEAGERAKEQRRAEQYASRIDTPVTNFAGNLAGGVLTPVNKPLMAVAGVKNLAPAGKTVGQMAWEGSKVGLAGGALYGAGAAEGGLRERARGAAEGGLWGAAGGAVLGPALGMGINKVSTGQFLPSQGGTVLDTVVRGLGVPNSSRDALRQILKSSGYSGDDIDRGVVNIVNRLKGAAESGDRIPLFAAALQDEFPAAQQNIQDVFQQLMTAPPRQGGTGRILTQALDDQYASQATYFDEVAQRRLGTSTVADELTAIGERRQEIGAQRDRSLTYAASDARTRGVRKQMASWYDDYSTGDGADREVMGAMRAAARELGFGGRTEVADAMASNPVALLNKFQELAFAKSNTPSGASPVLMQARNEAQKLLDDATRFGREAENVAFAKKVEGETGPFKQRQKEFRENYSQEEAIQDARGMLAKARDPVNEDGIAMWFNSLPEGEKQLVRTVWRQDLEKMLRGGNIDQDGAYLSNLKKLGLNSTLKRVLGEDGEAITRAISQLADEQKGLVALDPRKGLQERVVRGPSADRARNLYTTNPIARLGDRIPPASQLADIALMSGGQLPYITIARQAMKGFRPSARTREGLARLLAMREAPPLPAPTGRLSRMPPPGSAGVAGAASGGGQSAPAPSGPAPLRTSQRAPWTPVQVSQETPQIVPRVNTGAQQTVDRLRQKAVDLRQREADLMARAADERAIRATRIEAQQAEAAAKAAEAIARNERRITQAMEKAARRAGRAQERRLKQQGRENQTLAAREAEAAAARRQSEEALETALDNERRLKAAARDEAAALKDRNFAERVKANSAERAKVYSRAQSIEVAKANAGSEVSPITTMEETGHLALQIGDEPIIILDVAEQMGIRSADDFYKMMERVERDIIGPNANKPEKWGDLSRRLYQIVGREKLEKEILAGHHPGWLTPAERQSQKNMRTVGKAVGVGTATAIGVGGAMTAVRDIRKDQQAKRARRIMEDPELTKIIQRSLKAAKQYEGRADGRYDADVQQAVAQFQMARGLGKTSDPGMMDAATLEELENWLVFEGKPKLADQIRDIRRNKLKPKPKAKEN